MIAATGRMQHDRRPQDVADDQDLLVVPAVDERARDRAEEQVRQRGREEDEAGGERRAGRDRHDRDQRELVEPVAEQRDQLTRPQRRERAVEGEPDVRMLADALDRLDRRSGSGMAIAGASVIAAVAGAAADSAGAARASASNVSSDGDARPGPALPRTSGRSSATARGQGRRQAGLGARVARAAAAGSARRPAASRSRIAASCSSSSSCGTRTTRGEQEEGEAERQEHVADRGDVLDDRAAGSG